MILSAIKSAMKFKTILNYSLAAILAVCLAFSTDRDYEAKTNISTDSIPQGKVFGMRVRKIPLNSRRIYEPVIVKSAPENEATIVNLASGEVKMFYVDTVGKGDKLMSISSSDMGISWNDPQKEFDLLGEAFVGNQVMQDHNGTIHCIYHLYGKGDKGYFGTHLNLIYAYKETGKDWSRPKKIFDGYVGSLRGFIQLKNKTLLLPIYEADPLRANIPAQGETDYGMFHVICLYSDDLGKSWKTSENNLKIPVESTQVTRYGAVEPNVIELKNGKIWMLIRTNKGYLYESFSDNSGKTWQPPQASSFISSDSPATTVRLSDGRILMLWSGNQRYDDNRSYANGGREALHAAISKDDGRTWKGFREVLISPPSSDLRGDRGTAYPSAIEAPNGKIVFVSGQAEERAIAVFDPDWLEQKSVMDDFSKGLVQWTLFGADSTTLLSSVNNHSALLIRNQKDQKKSDTETVWNFPMTPKGELILEIIPNPGSKGINIALTDHFSVSYDTEASKNAIVNFPLIDNISIAKNLPVQVKVLWDTEKQKAAIYMNNKLLTEKTFQHKSLQGGFNYLRLGIPGMASDENGYFVRSVKVKKKK